MILGPVVVAVVVDIVVDNDDDGGEVPGTEVGGGTVIVLPRPETLAIPYINSKTIRL
jgi:hypothetical protein